MKKLLTTVAIAGAALSCVPAMAQSSDDDRGAPGKKGAVLIFPKVELRWRDVDADGTVTSDELIQDTFISLSNDASSATYVKMYFVQGDAGFNEPGVRVHPCWGFVDVFMYLTRENPVYWSVDTGAPGPVDSGPVTPWRALDLDDGTNPGRPDPLGSGDRVLRGYVLIWAAASDESPTCWNNLSGHATIVNYADTDAYEYEAIAYQCLGAEDANTPYVTDGEINFNGSEYDAAPDKLLLDFFADSDPNSTNSALSGGGAVVTNRTELTLLPLDQDFTGRRPNSTAVDYVVHNENEQRRSFLSNHCITCWDSKYLYAIAQAFGKTVLGTNRGKARIDTVADRWCPIICPDHDETATHENSVKKALVGVAMKLLSFDSGDVARAASIVPGLGLEDSASAPAIIFERLSGGGNLTDIREALSDEAP